MKKEAEKQIESSYIEGAVSILSVIRARSRRIDRIFVSESANKKNESVALVLRLAERFSIPLAECGDDFIANIALGTTHGGLIAEVGERETVPYERIFAKKNGFAVMLSGIEDPYNFGYAMRSLYAAGATGFILPERNWMSAAGVVVRASAGSSELCDIAICSNTGEMISLAKREGYSVVCAHEKGEDLFSADIKLPVLLVIGGEKRGIDRELIALCDKKVRIPYKSDFDKSLTAAAAAAVVGFEIMRKNL